MVYVNVQNVHLFVRYSEFFWDRYPVNKTRKDNFFRVIRYILTKGEFEIDDVQLCMPLSPIDIIFSLRRDGQLSKMLRNSAVNC